MSSPEWKRDLGPTTICGTTQAGKTTMCRALHYTWPGDVSIFFDLDGEPELGVDVHDVQELRGELERGSDAIVVRTPPEQARNPDLFEEVVRYLLELGEELRGTPARVQFIMDEIQDLPEEWVMVSQKRLQKRNIKPVGISQDPVSVPVRCRTISDWNGWLSPPPGSMRDSLESMPYPVEILEALDRYDMVMFGPDWEVVGRYRAPERFVVE